MSNFGLAYIEEVVGFVIFVALIWWKLVPVLRSLANKKAGSISEQLSAISNAKKAADDSIEYAKENLEKAKAEAIRIVDEARITAQRIKETGGVKAEQERNRILAKVAQDVDFELHRMRDELEKDFFALLLEAAKSLVTELLDQDLQHLLIADAIDAAAIVGVGNTADDALGTKAG